MRMPIHWAMSLIRPSAAVASMILVISCSRGSGNLLWLWAGVIGGAHQKCTLLLLRLLLMVVVVVLRWIMLARRGIVRRRSWNFCLSDSACSSPAAIQPLRPPHGRVQASTLEMQVGATSPVRMALSLGDRTVRTRNFCLCDSSSSSPAAIPPAAPAAQPRAGQHHAHALPLHQRCHDLQVHSFDLSLI